MFPWNLRQLISYFFALIIYSINFLKTARKTFATGNAIYPLPRTIIHITNDNSIFRKEGIGGGNQSSWILPRFLVQVFVAHLDSPLVLVQVYAAHPFSFLCCGFLFFVFVFCFFFFALFVFVLCFVCLYNCITLNIFYCSIRNNWIGHKFHNLETSSPIHT